jgi:hypothetical protein
MLFFIKLPGFGLRIQEPFRPFMGIVILFISRRSRFVAEACGDMEEITVESIFGVKAGVVWEALDQNGPSTIGDIAQARSLRREEVYGALGWLGRENKITVEWRGKAMAFSLRP